MSQLHTRRQRPELVPRPELPAPFAVHPSHSCSPVGLSMFLTLDSPPPNNVSGAQPLKSSWKRRAWFDLEPHLGSYHRVVFGEVSMLH